MRNTDQKTTTEFQAPTAQLPNEGQTASGCGEKQGHEPAKMDWQNEPAALIKTMKAELKEQFPEQDQDGIRAIAMGAMAHLLWSATNGKPLDNRYAEAEVHRLIELGKGE